VKFGIQFFPDVGPAQMSAADYWSQSLHLTEVADRVGFTHIRTVEHYFHPYGGYSTNPLTFLAAAAQRTRQARLVTGAILPIFNHPLKIAGEIGMVDAMSGGRLECGFARAFLPHEFRTWNRDLDESRARFVEGVAQIRRLLEEENVTSEGQFNSFKDVTSLPRPTQKPRPPFWVATSSSTESFVYAAQHGYGVMIIPRAPDVVRNWIDTYRAEWKKAGHPGHGSIMFATHMYCAPTRAQAIAESREHLAGYFGMLQEATADWQKISSKDYPNHPEMLKTDQRAELDRMLEGNALWIGTPDEIAERIKRYQETVGSIEHASLQVNFHAMPVERAEKSIRMFAEQVIPRFAE
jgi:alkanesulfonate monooxygenase SsuD/methylene tetrahydromethanopterin reductase-like flavin-dependent oxidoreductase (luciferase family)